LHVLGTPPAFVLSQDQTLHRKLIGLFPSFSTDTIRCRVAFAFRIV
jgi:hypothetical protein